MKNTSDKKETRNRAIRNSPAYLELRESLGKRIRLAVEVNEARKLRGWTQQDLAATANTSQKIISKLESGDIDIGFDLMQRVLTSLSLKMQVGKTTFTGGSETRGIFQLSSDGFSLEGDINDKTIANLLHVKQPISQNNGI